MHVPHGPSSPKTDPDAPAAAALLEGLADTSDALTVAIVRRDHDAIVAATGRAEALIERLASLDADAAGRLVPDPAVAPLAARIGSAARRNALLLERAWATDAALLRLLAMAARAGSDAAGAQAYAQPSPDPSQPAGWLDRSA
jgi:hypothetical protein